jgi:hypothetical protein
MSSIGNLPIFRNPNVALTVYSSNVENNNMHESSTQTRKQKASQLSSFKGTKLKERVRTGPLLTAKTHIESGSNGKFGKISSSRRPIKNIGNLGIPTEILIPVSLGTFLLVFILILFAVLM